MSQENARFFIRSQADVNALGSKLAAVGFDQYSTGAWDKNNNPMIGLSKQIGSRRIAYRGLVIVLDKSLFEAAEAVVDSVMNKKKAELRAWLDTEYADE